MLLFKKIEFCRTLFIEHRNTKGPFNKLSVNNRLRKACVSNNRHANDCISKCTRNTPAAKIGFWRTHQALVFIEKKRIKCILLSTFSCLRHFEHVRYHKCAINMLPACKIWSPRAKLKFMYHLPIRFVTGFWTADETVLRTIYLLDYFFFTEYLLIYT